MHENGDGVGSGVVGKEGSNNSFAQQNLANNELKIPSFNLNKKENAENSARQTQEPYVFKY